jgi:branched-chain amino acid transport system substrate-binding protein
VWLLVAGFTAACSLPGPPAVPAASPIASPERQPDVVLVGATVSLSGRFSREGAGLRAGYETWQRAVNEAGGLLIAGSRRPVQLRIYDDESDALTAVQLVERLVQQDGARLLLGPFSSQMTMATAATAERLGALMVAPDASSPEVYQRGLGMLVSVVPTDDRFFDGLFELATGLAPRPRTVAILTPEEVFFNVAADGARDRARALGVEPVLVERYALEARDLTAQLDRVAQARPSLFVFGAVAERLPLFGPQIRELRVAPAMRVVVPGQSFRDLANGLTGDLEGLLTLDWWSATLAGSGPLFGSAGDFALLFERIHGYPPDARAAAAAAAGLTLQLGIEGARSDDPRAVRAALSEVDARTFFGRLAWDGAGRNRAMTVPVLQYQGGRPLVVFPSEGAAAQLRYPPDR